MAVKQFCSHVDGNGNHCHETAEYATTCLVGSWIMGVWACQLHKNYLEVVMSLPGTRIGQLKFAPVLAPLDVLQNLDDEGVPRPEERPDPADLMPITLTCDRCGGPIYRQRSADGTRWVHFVPGTAEDGPDFDPSFDHEALPG